MASPRNIFNTARGLGDASSLFGGDVGGRVQRRVVGRGVSKMFQVNVFGLILWAEFFNWFRNAIQLTAGTEYWAGTFDRIAPLYEYGYTQKDGSRDHRPFFWPAVEETTLERRFGSGTRITSFSVSRSGVYAGGRFMADIRAVASGQIAARGVRRYAGAQASRLFWGALANPNANIFKIMAQRAARIARKNVEHQGLVDSGALKASIQIGESLEQLATLSRQKGLQALESSGRGEQFKHRFM